MKLALSTLLLLLAVAAGAQEVKYIKLKQTKIAYTPKQYYIVGVKDDREDTADVGTLRLGFPGKLTKVNLQGGVINHLDQFTRKFVPRDTTLMPIWLHVDKMNLSEKNTGNLQKVAIDVTFSFYIDGQKIMEYSGNSYQQASFEVSGYAGQLIRQTLESSITQFDGWLAEHKDDVTGPGSVTANVVLETTSEEAELIPYNRSKPLVWADFQGEADDLSLAAAATYSGVSVGYSSQTLGKKVTVDIKVAVYFDKSKSWVKPTAHTARALEHEQIHFDITAIKACELIQTLRSYQFTPEDYAKEIAQLQKQGQKEMQQMQNDYDKETRHGTIPAIQAQWVKKIREQMSKTTYY